MKNILLTIILLTGINTSFSAEVISVNSEPEIRATKEVTRKPTKKLRKKPRKKPIIQYNYYTTTIQSNCDEYINIINSKNKEIEALSKEINNLREKKNEAMRQQLKKEYDKEMKKFEERRKSY